MNVFITGASNGIGKAIAYKLASEGYNLFLFARSFDKLQNISDEIKKSHNVKVHIGKGDISNHKDVEMNVNQAIVNLGSIDILINNAGIALDAPKKFYEQSMEDILSMININLVGTIYTTHEVLKKAMVPANKGTVLNISSITGLNAPPFPGECIYHTTKAAMEGFSNSLRNELCGTDIKVLVLRPGCVATHFHHQRVRYDDKQYDDFFEGYTPLIEDDIANTASQVLSTPLNVSITSIDVVPTAQKSLYVVDREWNERGRN